MLMAYGPIVFDMIVNMHESDSQSGADFAQKDVIGRRPPIEFVGESESTYSIKGRVFPNKLGGLWQVYALEMWATSGRPSILVRGDGRVLGWFVIQHFRLSDKYLSKKGLGQMVEFEIDFLKDDAPDAASFFAGLIA